MTHCVFSDNEIALRVRGPGGRGGARVTIADCGIYDTQTGVRAEDSIEKLEITALAFGGRVSERIRFHNRGPTAGFENTGEREAPAMESLLRGGFPAR